MGCFPRGYFVLLGIRGIFELLKQVISPCPKTYRSLRYEYEYQHCIKNPNTDFSFGQYVRKCNDSLVVNMMAIFFLHFRTEWYLLLCYCCCVKHPAHRNSNSRVYPLRCQDSRPPTRSYTAAAAGVAVRYCCCCGLGTRTHTRTVPLTSGWRVYKPRRGTHAQQAGPDIYRLTVTERRL